MTTHQIKTTGDWFQRVTAGEKTAEIRKHDRDFQAGDILELVELSEKSGYHGVDGEEIYHREGEPSGQTHKVVVTHVLPSQHFDGLAPGYCLLSFRPHVEFGRIPVAACGGAS